MPKTPMQILFEMVNVDYDSPKAIEFLNLEKNAMHEAWNSYHEDGDFDEWYKLTYNECQ